MPRTVSFFERSSIMAGSITPFLWYDNQAEEAMNFYISVFKDGEVLGVNRLPEGAPGVDGNVITASFRLRNQNFTALNGGPMFKFTEAISFFVDCKDQAEVDYFWDTLIGDGGEASQCGWLKDKFGLSWQIIPSRLMELLGDPNPERSGRAMQAMLQMGKIDIATLEAA